MNLERTDVAQQHYDRVTGEIPITVSDSADYDMFRDESELPSCELIDGICEACD